MTPVTFATIPNGRIEALLNHILVGIVSPWPDGGGRILGTVEATYQMLLPVNGAIELPSPTTSLVGARRALLHAIADWHQEADHVRYAVMISDLRAQAEGERG